MNTHLFPLETKRTMQASKAVDRPSRPFEDYVACNELQWDAAISGVVRRMSRDDAVEYRRYIGMAPEHMPDRMRQVRLTMYEELDKIIALGDDWRPQRVRSLLICDGQLDWVVDHDDFDALMVEVSWSRDPFAVGFELLVPSEKWTELSEQIMLLEHLECLRGDLHENKPVTESDRDGPLLRHRGDLGGWTLRGSQ